MSLERSVLSKPLVAKFALIRTFASVSAHVNDQVLARAEGLSAHFANVRPLSGMYA